MSAVYWRTWALFVLSVALLTACASDEPGIELVTPSSVAPAEPLDVDTTTVAAETTTQAPTTTEPEARPTSTAPSTTTDTEQAEARADSVAPTTTTIAETTTTAAGPDPVLGRFCAANAELDALFDVDVNDSAEIQRSAERQQELLATMVPPEEITDDFAIVRQATDRYFEALRSAAFNYQLASSDIFEIFGDGTVEDASARLDVFEAGNCVTG